MTGSFLQKRKQLVELLEPSFSNPLTKKAFLETKRELFVPNKLIAQAYIDEALPIGNNQTISQPSTIAIMLEMLELKQKQTVLEIGSGCGYVLALLSKIVGEKGKVFGTEIIKELFETAKKNLARQGNKNIELFNIDGSEGLKEKAPFDRILVSAACPFVPKPLFDQIKEKGIIVAPTGDNFSQVLTQVKKINGKPIKKDYPGSFFSFVPLQGKHGFE